MVIRPAVPEILGGVVPPPQMLLGCQKQQMLLTVNSNIECVSMGSTNQCVTDFVLLIFFVMMIEKVPFPVPNIWVVRKYE